MKNSGEPNDYSDILKSYFFEKSELYGLNIEKRKEIIRFYNNYKNRIKFYDFQYIECKNSSGLPEYDTYCLNILIPFNRLVSIDEIVFINDLYLFSRAFDTSLYRFLINFISAKEVMESIKFYTSTIYDSNF